MIKLYGEMRFASALITASSLQHIMYIVSFIFFSFESGNKLLIELKEYNCFGFYYLGQMAFLFFTRDELERVEYSRKSRF